MLNKKFLSGAILTAAVCLTACSAGGTEVTETVSETISKMVTTAAETTAVTTKATTETTTETATETTAKIIDTSGVEYMKEALQAEWNEFMGIAELYAADLNGDGVKELFVKYLVKPMKDGVIYVYDVSDGIKKLYEISVSNSTEKLYTDENGIVHFILKAKYSGNAWEDNFACFDITYDSIKMPFYVYIHGWFDGGAHVFDYNIYKNCEVVPTNDVNRNFDPEKAELIGTYDENDIRKAWKEEESNEVSEIIQQEVFDGMTYTSDTTEVYFGSSYNEDTEEYELKWDFEDFWQEAAPKLAEEYNK